MFRRLCFRTQISHTFACCRNAEKAFKAAFPVQEMAACRKAGVTAITAAAGPSAAGDAEANPQQAAIHLSDGYPVEEFR